MPDLSLGQAIIFYFIAPLLTLLFWVVLISVVLSWLISFNVINPRNQFVAALWRLTTAFTEPFLGPIRRILPPLGGFDLSPIVLILLIFFVRDWLLLQQIFPLL